MECLWLAGGAVLMIGLLFLWPMRFGSILPQHRPMDLVLKEGEQRQMKNLVPGSEHYRKIVKLLEQHSYRRTPAGVFGAGAYDPRCRSMTLVCGDCAITVREDGTVSVDGQAYAMGAAQSKSLVDAVQGIVAQP